MVCEPSTVRIVNVPLKLVAPPETPATRISAPAASESAEARVSVTMPVAREIVAMAIGVAVVTPAMTS